MQNQQNVNIDFNEENNVIDYYRDQIFCAINAGIDSVSLKEAETKIPKDLSARIARAVRFTLLHRISITLPCGKNQMNSDNVSEQKGLYAVIGKTGEVELYCDDLEEAVFFSEVIDLEPGNGQRSRVINTKTMRSV